MEKEQFDKIVKLFEELNTHLEKIGARLGSMENSMDLLREEMSKWVRLTTVR